MHPHYDFWITFAIVGIVAFIYEWREWKIDRHWKMLAKLEGGTFVKIHPRGRHIIHF